MTQEHFGLFVTPPSAREKRLGLIFVVAVFAVVAVVLPVCNVPLREVDSYLPAINAIMCAADLIIATMLYTQAAVFRSRALTALASGYVFSAIMVVTQALTFPGAFSPDGLLGAGLHSAGWIATFRRVTFPIAAILYVLLREAEFPARLESERPPARIFLGLATAVVLAVLGTLWATAGQDYLPAFFINRREGINSIILAVNVASIALSIPPIVLLLRRNRSVLDTWLIVSLSCWVAGAILNAPIHARFTVGFYALFAIMFVSNFVIMLALLAESSRLYAKLVLSVAARDRERRERLMSIDAVAAAIAHEVGQPLTAATLSANAGLRWLKSERPNPDMAIKSLIDTSDAVHRTFDVIRSIRSTYSKRAGPFEEINLNDLVHETTAFVDAELTGHGIVLRLALEPALPAVRANRVQMQRVLINLLVNAIDALSVTSRRGRTITVRTTAPEPGQVLLEVADSGAGIASDKMGQVFEPFVTTKSSGTGLGLPLSRTIVEEHHGRLWATSSEGQGATFHLQMPTAALADAGEAEDPL